MGRILASAAACALVAAAAPAVAQAAADPAPSPALKVVLVLVAVAIGIAVGVIPALLLGSVLGLLPRSPLAGVARRAWALAPRPGPVLAAPVVTPIALDPQRAASPVAPPVTFVPAAVAAPRERHRELYDAEYSEAVLRLEALRRTIAARLARGAP
jgi:hypothetical protein